MEKLTYAEAMAAVYEHQFPDNDTPSNEATDGELIEHNLSGLPDPYSAEAVRSNISSRLNQ